jgi:hypothetical protein
MKIKNWKQFNENMKPLNEGGGAGKDINFNDISFKIGLTLTLKGITEYKNEINLGESFDVSGYQDGMNNISTIDMFETKLEYKLDHQKMLDLTLGQIRYYSDQFFPGDDDPDKTTLRQLLESGEENDFDIILEGGGSYSYMFGGGYIHSSVKQGQTILSETLDLNNGYDVYIDDTIIYDCLFKYADENVIITLTAKEKLANLWIDLFENNLDYDTFVKDEIENGQEKDEIISEEGYYDMIQNDNQLNYGVHE